mmetsp:Transcript_48191/g.79892  ORF Transcript_48191/g.79892 Transcript_48191/m.79892 type:complete len:207 (-) Transcript_48191:791-1411(-)
MRRVRIIGTNLAKLVHIDFARRENNSLSILESTTSHLDSPRRMQRMFIAILIKAVVITTATHRVTAASRAKSTSASHRLVLLLQHIVKRLSRHRGLRCIMQRRILKLTAVINGHAMTKQVWRVTHTRVRQRIQKRRIVHHRHRVHHLHVWIVEHVMQAHAMSAVHRHRHQHTHHGIAHHHVRHHRITHTLKRMRKIVHIVIFAVLW